MKNINFEEYKQLALATEMPSYQMPIVRFTPFDARLLHCILGIVGEIGELKTNDLSANFDAKNQLEELGDLYWYFAMASDIFGFKLSNVPNIELNKLSNTTEDIFLAIDIQCTEILDLYKKKICYGKIITNEQIAKVIFDLQDLVFCHYYELVPEALKLNIAKLKLRYPDKYSDKSAIERKDKI